MHHGGTGHVQLVLCDIKVECTTRLPCIICDFFPVCDAQPLPACQAETSFHTSLLASAVVVTVATAPVNRTPKSFAVQSTYPIAVHFAS